MAYVLAVTGVLLCGQGGSVDLDRLGKHNVLEHNASLTRHNVQPPNEYAPIEVDPNLVAQLMRMSSNDYLTLNDLAAARVLRESQAGPIDALHAQIARAECAIILEVFGGEKMEIDKNLLSTWLTDGRFPDGWEPPKKSIGLFASLALERRIKTAMDAIRNAERA